MPAEPRVSRGNFEAHRRTFRGDDRAGIGTAGAAAIGKPDEEAGEVPVAFVVRAPGSEVSEAELQAHVEGCLAHYKHPGEYRFVESVPKSASGKILRRELRAGL